MSVRIIEGDCRDVLRTLPDASVHCCVTSPPYFCLRDYGVEGQMGLEATPDDFVAGMVAVFRDVRRVLRDDGTLWLNIGDSYAASGRGGGGNSIQNNAMGREISEKNGFRMPPIGYKQKDIIGIPWMLAFALRADGWYLRQDIIWSKPNPMPESVRDRCTKAHEYLFLLSKSARYYYDADAIAEELAPASVELLSQAGLTEQTGSSRVPGKTNGNMKAVGNIAGNMSERGIGRTTEGLNLKSAAEKLRIDGMRNKRSVWEIATAPFKEAHFATFPPALVEPCIKAGCPQDGTVLDPFFGAGTTGLVADRLQRNCIGIELSTEYAAIARKRISGDALLFADVI